MMRLFKLLSTLYMAVATTACSAQTFKGIELNYEGMVHLDAESLAENGIAEAYSRLLPELEKYVAKPVLVEDIYDPDLPRYAVRVAGAEYVIYSLDGEDEAASWGAATYVFFKIVNDQLAGTDVRFYAFNSGNDLGGMFITPGQAKASRKTISRRSDLPYLPEASGPWFGQHH